MYGAADTAEALDEHAPLRPLTPYAESKVKAEEALRELAGDGFSPVAMRNATVHGVSPRLRLDIVLNNLVAWAHTTGAIRLQSDGSAWRPSTSATSPPPPTLLAAPVEAVHDEAFNIGSDDQNYRIRELAETVRANAGVRGRVCGGRGRRSAQLPRRLLEVRVPLPRLPLRAAGRRRRRRARRRVRTDGLTLEEFEGHRYIRLDS